MRAVMDAASDPDVDVVVAVCSAQVAKTETLLNVVGYHMDLDPAPMLWIAPTLEMAEATSKDRIAPMLRDTPALRGKVADARARDSGNTLLHKTFPGGHLTLAGANSPASLASRPIRIVLCDEVDRYPHSAGTEGDPVNLARKRTATFWNRKVVLVSTPTVKGHSRIEAAYEESDRRRYYVPCPDCGEEQVLLWPQVRWPEGRPEEAAYCCVECGALWDDATRMRAIRKGEWRAEGEFKGTAGFWLNQLYSPWCRLGEAAREFLSAKRSPETLQVFVNTVLGESWEDQGQRIDPAGIMGRLEDWGPHPAAPAGVLVVTCGVDVQDDRIEVERVGWGLDDESWSLDHRIFYGDPASPAVWRDLDGYLLEQSATKDGRTLRVMATAVDTGGHHTQAAYRFCRERFGRRVYAIKGVAGEGKPVWPKRASRNNKGGVLLFLVGVDAAKDSIMARLKLAEPGAGYCHFPVGRELAYFEQFAAESRQTKLVKGFPVRTWVKRDGVRNEALDLRVYAYAALQSLNFNWSRVRAGVERVKVPEAKPAAKAPEAAPEPPQVEVPAPPPRPVVRQQGRRRIGYSSYMMR